jgi:hypothetical protein
MFNTIRTKFSNLFSRLSEASSLAGLAALIAIANGTDVGLTKDQEEALKTLSDIWQAFFVDGVMKNIGAALGPVGGAMLAVLAVLISEKKDNRKADSTRSTLLDKFDLQ